MTLFEHGAYYLKKIHNSIKCRRKDTFIWGIQKEGGGGQIACPTIENKKLVLHYLRICFLLFIDFALAILGIVISKALGNSQGILASFYWSRTEAQRGEMMLTTVCCTGSWVYRTRAPGKGTAVAAFSEKTWAEQHLEHDIWNILYSYRELYKQEKGTLIKGITDQLSPPRFICST